jgi:membrane-bound metal-dependent hydrolase YbcI (DUF457 family)
LTLAKYLTGPMMFAIGHFALGYLAGKGSSRLLKVKLNLPLLLVASVLPDVDLILQFVNPTLFMHRGPTHAIITFTVLLIPFFIIYRKRAVPYYAALLSHALIGDFFTGGLELFWPVSQDWFGFENVNVKTLVPVTVELVLFATALLIMLRTKDLQSLLKPGKYNWTLFIAFGAVLGPMLQIGGDFEGYLPALLVVPSLFCLILFTCSIIIGLRHGRG